MMDASAENSWWIMVVTLLLWTLPALFLNRARPVFWWSALIVFVGIWADLLPRRSIEMGGLVHAFSGGVSGCLLLALKRALKNAWQAVPAKRRSAPND